MRYLVGFVFVVALTASPLNTSAQSNQDAKASQSKGGAAPSQPSTPVDTPQPVRGVQRWHPEAFVAPKAPDKAKPDFEIEYVPLEPPPRNRKRAIVLGVTIPIVIVGVGIGIGAAVVWTSW